MKIMHVQEDGNSSSDGQKWGFNLPQLYQVAVKFYKEKEGKAIQLSYASRLQFVGLSQQVAHGPCRPESLRPLGVLDVVGRDRREAWQRLGELSRPDAMLQYIELLDAACPIFRPFAEAHKRDLEAQQRKREEERVAEQRRQLIEEKERHQRELEHSRRAETKRRIQDVLNRQTYAQFRAYAAQQYPGNPEQQALLILKLQRQHYQQYMQQLFQQQRHQSQQVQQAASPGSSGVSGSQTDGDGSTAEGSSGDGMEMPCLSSNLTGVKTIGSENESKDEEPSSGMPAARLWTRGDLEQFKATIKAERGSAVITLGQGEVATVRVPKREDGTCLFWEFATDSFDLGFGVSFEKGPTTQHEVTVEVSNGADEEEQVEEDEENQEGGAVTEGSVPPGSRPQVTCVVPVYRRDCHQHVYAGSHRFPEHQGTYLLRFDNSYSLWRSKTLYYRVFYTREDVKASRDRFFVATNPRKAMARE